MLTSLFLILLDLAAVGGIAVGIVVTGLRLRPSRLAKADNAHDAATRGWFTMAGLLILLVLVILGTIWGAIPAYGG